MNPLEQIWRYPVKSLRGESIARAAVDRRGLVGDSLWAVRDELTGKLGSGKDTRRFRRFPGPPLLELAARYPRRSRSVGAGKRFASGSGLTRFGWPSITSSSAV